MSSDISARRQYVSPTPGEFPLIASTPWNAAYQTTPELQDFAKVKECGFNAALFTGSISQITKIINPDVNGGIKLIVSNPSLWESIEEMRSFVRTVTGSANNTDNPNALNGYDEMSNSITAWGYAGQPKASQFDTIFSPYEKLYFWDTARNIVVNLIGEPSPAFISPHKTYKDYVNAFDSHFKPVVLVYNYYPFYYTTQNILNTSYSQFYQDLMIYSRKYRKEGTPFWNYVQCTQVNRKNGSTLYPEATESTLRFQIFTSLAFCVQGLVFWTFGLRKSDANDTFKSALIDINREFTKAGIAVQKIIKEVKCLSDIFLDAIPGDYYTVCQNYDDPNNPNHVTPSLPTSSNCPFKIDLVGKGAFVTTFTNKDKKFPFKTHHYLMIVSQDTVDPQIPRVMFRSELEYGLRVRAFSIIPDLDNDNGKYIRSEFQTDSAMDIYLAPSGYLLFEYEVF